MTIEVRSEAEIWTVLFNRPEVRNAVDRKTAEALSAAFRAFETDEQARGAILGGCGENFCAGANLKAVAAGRPKRRKVKGGGPMGPTRRRLSKPVIAAVNGYAVAGGPELALWCDLRVMEEDAWFGGICRRWGVPLIDGGTVKLPQLVGQGRALDRSLTGREVGAKEALNCGPCYRVVAPGTALAAASALGRKIASFPQRYLRSDRKSVYTQWGNPEEEALRDEFLLGQPGRTCRGRSDCRGERDDMVTGSKVWTKSFRPMVLRIG